MVEVLWMYFEVHLKVQKKNRVLFSPQRMMTDYIYMFAMCVVYCNHISAICHETIYIYLYMYHLDTHLQLTYLLTHSMLLTCVLVIFTYLLTHSLTY